MKSTWTMRAIQAVMRRLEDVRFIGGAEFERCQDIIEWLDARDDRGAGC